MKNTLKITEVNYLPPHTHMGHTLQEHCKFEAVDEEGGVAVFSAYGEHAKKLMRKIISKKKVVCFCSFCTISAPLKDKKGAIVIDDNGNHILTEMVRFIVKRILDYTPKTTYTGTDNPIWVFPFLFTYPKLQRRKRVSKREISERLFPVR